MQDNAPPHPAKNILVAMGITVLPPSSPDLKPIENLWSILKRKIYEGGHSIPQNSSSGRKYWHPQTIYGLTVQWMGEFLM